MSDETPWFHDRGVDDRPYTPHDSILARRAGFWLLVLAGALLASYAAYARPCDAYVVTGWAVHGDRDHNYRSLTTGAGCEVIRGDWRYDAVGFLNSFSRPTLLLGASYLPLKAGPVSVGAAAGLALFGYQRQVQPAAGLVVEWLGRDFGADVILIPPVDGVGSGGLLWLRAKLLRRWEPLK